MLFGETNTRHPLTHTTPDFWSFGVTHPLAGFFRKKSDPVPTKSSIVSIFWFVALMQDDEEGLHRSQFFLCFGYVDRLNCECFGTVFTDGTVKVHLTLTTSVLFVMLPTSGKCLNSFPDIDLAICFVGYTIDKHNPPLPMGSVDR